VWAASEVAEGDLSQQNNGDWIRRQIPVQGINDAQSNYAF
jgi:hypothetical protein